MDLFGVFADFAAGAGMSFPASLNEFEERSSLRSMTSTSSQHQSAALIKRDEVIAKQYNSATRSADQMKQWKQANNAVTKRQLQGNPQQQKSQSQKRSAEADLPMNNKTPVENNVNTEMLESIWCRPIYW